MIDYETFVKIKVLKNQHALKCSQIAEELNLDYRTVEKWLDLKHYQQRKSPQRASKLDPFKGQIVRMLQTYPYTATQIFQRIREDDFPAATPSSKSMCERSGHQRSKRF